MDREVKTGVCTDVPRQRGDEGVRPYSLPARPDQVTKGW